MKNLPTLKVGAVFAFGKYIQTYKHDVEGDSSYYFTEAQMQQLVADGWFAPVVWEPKDGDRVWFLSDELMPLYFMYNKERYYDLYNSGNLFPSKQAAEKAAEQVKALLQAWRANNYDD